MRHLVIPMGLQTVRDIRQLVGHVKDAVVGAVFPNRCLVCGDVSLRTPKLGEDVSGDGPRGNGPYVRSRNPDIEHRLNPYVCPSCSVQFFPIRSPICNQCGIMFGDRDGEDHLCGDCIQRPKRYRKARALCVYERTGLELIHALKYRGKIQLARPFGALLYATFIQHWKEGEIDTVIPVPLHIERFRERGFNQTYLLVRDWSGLCLTARPADDGLPAIHLDRESLVRERKSDSQTGSGREKRIANVENVFTVRDRSKVTGKRILLIDDVYTTGATVEACARILLRNGAEHVDILTLARAM